MPTAAKSPPKAIKPLKEVATNGDAPEVQEPKVLDLTALTPSRRLVKLPTKGHPEGQNFELRLVEDFGIEMQQKLLAWSRRYQQLMQADEDLDEHQTARLRFLLDNLFEQVLDAPVVIKRGMDDAVRNRVVTAFSWAPVLAQQETQLEMIRRMIEKEMITQDQVDEVMTEMRADASRLTSEN